MRNAHGASTIALPAAAPAALGLVLVALASAQTARAEALPGPRETVVAAHGRIEKLLAQRAPEGSAAAKRRDADLTREVTELLDLDQMARDALGSLWEQRSPPERAEYSGLLKRLVERSYLRQARTHHEFTVEFGEASSPRRGRVEVPTTIRVTRRGRTEEVEVVYTLAEAGGRFRVVDIETDGVSTVRNYRSQFRRIVDRDGFEALLERMRDRLEAGEVDL